MKYLKDIDIVEVFLSLFTHICLGPKQSLVTFKHFLSLSGKLPYLFDFVFVTYN